MRRLNQYEAELLKLLEVMQGNELTKIQEFLNRIAYEKQRVQQLEKEFKDV